MKKTTKFNPAEFLMDFTKNHLLMLKEIATKNPEIVIIPIRNDLLATLRYSVDDCLRNKLEFYGMFASDLPTLAEQVGFSALFGGLELIQIFQPEVFVDLGLTCSQAKKMIAQMVTITNPDEIDVKPDPENMPKTGEFTTSFEGKEKYVIYSFTSKMDAEWAEDLVRKALNNGLPPEVVSGKVSRNLALYPSKNGKATSVVPDHQIVFHVMNKEQRNAFFRNEKGSRK